MRMEELDKLSSGEGFLLLYESLLWYKYMRANTCTVYNYVVLKLQGYLWLCISHCFSVCDEMEFKCEESGSCINDGFVCDGRSHCSDGSDENTPECCKTISAFHYMC